jgi:hypothetical protein
MGDGDPQGGSIPKERRPPWRIGEPIPLSPPITIIETDDCQKEKRSGI